jgi:hypothetical protein
MDIPPPDTMPQTAEDSELASLTAGDVDPMEWHARISAETVKNRGHPNVCKMLDFFEDREFYYREFKRFVSRESVWRLTRFYRARSCDAPIWSGIGPL